MAQIPTDERRFKPPKVQPTVSYVRPTGPAPQSKLGSPSAVGFSPAYTPTVQPRPENKGFAAAATTPPKSFFPTKEFWADPTGYGQPLYDNFLSKILPSKERLDNSSFSYLNLLDPKNSFTPSMIPGIIGSAVPGGKAVNLLGEAIKSSGYADTIFQYGPLAALGVTAAKMFGNRNDPIAMARNLMPLFQSVVTGNVVGGLNDMTGLDWGPAAPAIYPKANLGFVNPQYPSSANAITPQWKMQDPVKPSYNPLQITTSKPPPLVKQDIKPYGTKDFNLETVLQDIAWLDDYWKTVKNGTLNNKPLLSVDPDDGLPVAEDYTKEEWESYKKSLDTYIDPLGNEWDSKDQWDYFQQSMKDYAAGLQPPKQESIDDATRRLAAQMSEGGERPVSYYQELLRQSYKTFEDLTNAGTDFNRFPTDVTPNKWIEDNNTFLPSMMGKDNLPMSGFGASTSPSDDALEPWDYKQRPPGYFDERGSFRTNNPLRSMGNEPIKTLPMGQLGVSAQIQLRRDIFMGADLNKLPEPTKKAIYESFDMGWHPGLGDDEEDNSRMAGIFEAITGSPQPESNVGDGEYDTGNYMVEEYPLMQYINSPESGLPNLSDYLVPTGQDAQGRMTFEGDYYKWEQDFRKAWRDNPGLFRDTKLHPEFLPEWANPRYRDNAGE